MARERRRLKDIPPDDLSNQEVDNYPDLNTLDVFALCASIGVSKRETDPVVIARDSFRIAIEMKIISDRIKANKTTEVAE